MIDFAFLPDDWRGFALLWAGTYAVLMAIYFGLGSVLVILNRRHPERRIQERTRSTRDRKDIRQSVIALALISVYVAGGLFAQAAGWTLFAVGETTVWSFVGWLVVSFVLYDAWFYWGHRAMHTKFLYRFHELHHRSITPTTWSNNSDSLVGASVEQGYFLVVPLLLPIPPEVLILHKLYDQVTGMISHCGYEYFAGPGARTPWPGLCTIFHDQHHSNFRCNYGNTFSFWDRWMGTLHPRYDGLVQRFETIGKDKAPTSSETGR
ncbi:sterol desaturase family protein [Polymorphum gilvum]|uniref:Sterol desaturase family protein n=1 Tax=Polymorphum gilvum (strain LMG 25793 / CGMCC 1.9160 / SL003B-26A1) TaxID=991905 RepID=F2IUW8_POLGS|nr:sterol desaturase family protein [Polymorphum gilvum]ADZ70197.1 Sterol desaturase family protein [Polymorphum gilvum SL003B-26A1]